MTCQRIAGSDSISQRTTFIAALRSACRSAVPEPHVHGHETVRAVLRIDDGMASNSIAAKLALVTGASGGIGLELAKLLAAAGYDLVLAARSADKLAQIRDELQPKYGITVDAVPVDLTSHDALAKLYARFPSCDVLVNNAGFANSGAFAQIAERELLDELRLNVLAVTELARFYLPGMLERKHGRILNLASTAAFLPGPNMAVYYASKAYVLSLSEALAYEVRGSGVTVTALCPGPTVTGFQERANVESTLLFRFGHGDAAKVAKAGFVGMMRGKTVVVPGLVNKLTALSPRLSPRGLLLAVSAKLTERR
jgi:hypothetical protein